MTKVAGYFHLSSISSTLAVDLRMSGQRVKLILGVNLVNYYLQITSLKNLLIMLHRREWIIKMMQQLTPFLILG